MDAPIQEIAGDEYPTLLREIADPPRRLFVRGTLPPYELPHLCVVGSRKYSPYGREACEKLVEGLRGYDVVIVSGLALGTDAIAHRAALSSGLTTIAVPGSGLGERVLYPRTNLNLARDILESGGALLSEFEENFQARPESFPQRNRIMAGLSQAVLVIEAEERSGTLITSRLATEYNRDVFTIPHSIFSRTGAGPHVLLRLGATLVRNSDDLLEALHIEKEADKLATLDVANLSENEQKVVTLLGSPLGRDELLQQLPMSTQEANVLLTTMEIKGLIIERLGEIRLT